MTRYVIGDLVFQFEMKDVSFSSTLDPDFVFLDFGFKDEKTRQRFKIKGFLYFHDFSFSHLVFRGVDEYCDLKLEEEKEDELVSYDLRLLFYSLIKNHPSTRLRYGLHLFHKDLE